MVISAVAPGKVYLSFQGGVIMCLWEQLRAATDSKGTAARTVGREYGSVRAPPGEVAGGAASSGRNLGRPPAA